MADIKYKTENVVAVAELGVDIPMAELSGGDEAKGYQPEHFEGMVYKPGDEKVASLIFPSGKIVCTGAKSVKEAKSCVSRVVRKLREKGAAVPSKYQTSIENMLASARLGKGLDLEKLSSRLKGAEYYPEQLPCLVYKVPKPGMSFLLFPDGKVICTGGRTEKGIEAGFGKLHAELKKAGVQL
jgi:transcription initiation factor TFIID TATA-box-binding protein